MCASVRVASEKELRYFRARSGWRKREEWIKLHQFFEKQNKFYGNSFWSPQQRIQIFRTQSPVFIQSKKNKRCKKLSCIIWLLSTSLFFRILFRILEYRRSFIRRSAPETLNGSTCVSIFLLFYTRLHCCRFSELISSFCFPIILFFYLMQTQRA